MKLRIDGIVQHYLDTKDIGQLRQALGEFTPRQLVEYQNLEDAHEDLTLCIWSASETWGFECYWYSLSIMSKEQKQELIEESEHMDVEPPENITPDKKLKDHLIFLMS